MMHIELQLWKSIMLITCYMVYLHLMVINLIHIFSLELEFGFKPVLEMYYIDWHGLSLYKDVLIGHLVKSHCI